MNINISIIQLPKEGELQIQNVVAANSSSVEIYLLSLEKHLKNVQLFIHPKPSGLSFF